GAGPSLNKNLEVLKTLSNRALIFAGGSSMNALTNHSFLPHFGAGIDPNPPQYQRLISNAAYEVPYFYRNRMFHEAFRLIHGPRLYVTGCGGYYISDWFEEKLKIKGDFIDEGHNVVNFSMEIAQAMGCNPIILVGLDLAYTDLKSYASGVVVDRELTEDSILKTKDMDSSAFLRNDIFGKPVYTLWKWVAESEWITTFSERYPKRKLINATEGGIGFQSVENLSLQEVKERYLKREYDLRSLVHVEIENSALNKVTDKKVLKLMQQLFESLTKAISLSEDVLHEIDRLKTKISTSNKTDGNLLTGRIALCESDLSSETCFEAILNVFAVIYNKVLSRETHLIRYDRSLKTEVDKDLKRLDLNAKKFAFLRDVAKANQEVMKEALCKYEAEGHDIGPFFKTQVRSQAT
ncbi:MAG: hypothetical protein K0S07_1765, partial [Chlamydiales bacterium]|nr:hypothetical protein [Chlamydiales bacterium]